MYLLKGHIEHNVRIYNKSVQIKYHLIKKKLGRVINLFRPHGIMPLFIL